MNDIQPFLLVDDKPFTGHDFRLICEEGLTSWALGNITEWQDRVLRWDALPMMLRQSIANDALYQLDTPLAYAVPFRAMGRVVTFALLPETPRPIEVVRRGELSRSAPVHYIDPPVPFPLFGSVSPNVLADHSQAVGGFLKTFSRPDFEKRLMGITEKLIAQKMTKTEVFYYLLFMRAVGCRSWQIVQEFTGLLTLEWVINQAVNLAPGQGQQLAYEHLVNNRPFSLPASIDKVEVR